MTEIRTQDAVGHVLCHDITRIVKDVVKDTPFRKGHIVEEQDIEVLLSLGKEHLFVWEAAEGMLHENEAAERLCSLCAGSHMTSSAVREGKIELFADCDGLFCVDTAKLEKINSLSELIVATRHGGFGVKQGDKLAGTKVIPLVIPEKKIQQAETIAGSAPLLNVVPYVLKRAGVIVTGNEVYSGRIPDTFTGVLGEKFSQFGVSITAGQLMPDDPAAITQGILAMRPQTDIIVVTGGMSVDPDDRTPLAIKNTGATIVSYGAPVFPGAMFMLSYLDDIPVLGLPACVMYAKRTIFDLVLPTLLAGKPVTAQMLASFGQGGLCLSCDVCTFPNCGFGK